MSIDPLFEYFETHASSPSRRLFGANQGSKEYKRYDRIALSLPLTLDLNLEKVSKREVDNTLCTDGIDENQLATLLYWAVGRGKVLERAPYLSHGDYYPLEVYLMLSKAITPIGAGAYHYNVREHCLERLPYEVASESVLKGCFLIPKGTKGAEIPVILSISFIKERSIAEYGAQVYPHALLEAGQVGQTAYLIASSMGIRCSLLDTFHYEKTNEIYGADGVNEQFVHHIALGSF